jgi:hypothetical protein
LLHFWAESFVFLRKILEPKRDDWRRLHNEELHYLYPSLNVISVINQGGCGLQSTWHTWEEQRHTHRVLVGKPKEKRALERPRHRWGIY